MNLPPLSEIRDAAEFIRPVVQPTPQIAWPLLAERCNREVWVKHENHNPTGAFKVRGGLVYIDHLIKNGAPTTGVIAATRGNHGQSVALAARSAGLPATIVVPHGNSILKNQAMAALGAELIEEGDDFTESFRAATAMAEERGLHMMPAIHPVLVRGVATYGLELLEAVPDLETIYVPVGMGSGICGVISARNALGLEVKIVGVIAENAPAYALSFDEKRKITTESADTLADGVATRDPNEEVLEILWANVDRFVSVSDDQILAAIRHYFTDSHNIAEGAGAAPLAALLKEKDRMSDKKVGLILSGGNLDVDLYLRALRGGE